MLEIDGSLESGSGTILRLAVAFSALTEQQLHIFNIRQNRSQPGLKAQHLEAVLTAAKLCNAETNGAKLNSKELWFSPHQIKGGDFEARIGTAGSIPMLIMTVLPICTVAKEAVHLHITSGGTDTANAPTISYLQNVLLKALRRMGNNASIIVHKYGYYPKGMGDVTLNVQPSDQRQPIRLENMGRIRKIKGISICTFLASKKVAERQAKSAAQYLSSKGFTPDIQIINDVSNPLQKGSSIALWIETDGEAILGADAIGELGKPSESVGEEAAEKIFSEIMAKPTVDVHLADMLIPYMALSEGSSVYFTRMISEHLKTNIWLAETIMNAPFKITKEDELYKVEKK